MDKIDVVRQFSPLALAYLGDGVYELYVRNHVLRQGNCQNHKLHEKSKKFVSCEAQDRFLTMLTPILHEDELEIVRRGRNAKSNSKPRNADYGTYHAATGFEALWGYLYLAGEHERLRLLFDKILEEAQ
ncbi:MAG: Mini-ribonuclease 3 [Clostridia bacterium]|nr:Mini-ribonuclease 3 [Clostridia bacterium]